MVFIRLYREGKLEREDVAVQEIESLARQDDVVLWIDYTDPAPDDLSVVETVYGLHRLAVEDAVHDFQRPKLDRYPHHLFLSAYEARLTPGSSDLAVAEISAFITRNALVTVHGPDFDTDGLRAHWDAEPDLAAHGVPFLFWGLLDMIVDGHFDAAQELDGCIDALEDSLFDDHMPDHDLQRRTFEVRKNLVRLRRVVLPMREVLNTLLRRDDLVGCSPAMQPFLQDVYDHVLRVSEWTESLRDLVTTILETHISIQGNNMNLIMKKVTSWAAIIAVPTAVTGFFGQNVPFFGFQDQYGLWLSMGLMVFGTAFLYGIFKKRDWI
ncbi:magnesium transporter CorA family protein [Paenarthrobacter sp. DKR-5]|uniref:magnesium transporter CorA family protein n=1 Tax=Paenarthrobacter sp. DKR-5 TaxID=2835535 RepID=UPI001BDD80E0|nr:magnesium transporter CorA family protein [Paenarthrobacter sp. DKR-5]MBT1004012.1 magnesium transporter CorA family protein [Paenarthrobacter sp. DKR-5]